MTTRSFLIACAACAMLLAGCASGPTADPRDPLEPFNRHVNTFNRGLDRAALKPVATVYERALPGVVRQGISNFFANLGDLASAANNLLQLKPVAAVQSTMRVVVNTTFGLGGLLDIASDAGIDRHKADFGSTLAHWGVPPGAYLVLPLLGPTTVRDAVALPVDWLSDPLRQVTPVAERTGLLVTHGVDARARLLPLDYMLEEAMDPYTFMRDAYLQHRAAAVGATDTQDEEPADGPSVSDSPAPGPGE